MVNNLFNKKIIDTNTTSKVNYLQTHIALYKFIFEILQKQLPHRGIFLYFIKVKLVSKEILVSFDNCYGRVEKNLKQFIFNLFFYNKYTSSTLEKRYSALKHVSHFSPHYSIKNIESHKYLNNYLDVTINH